MREAASWGFVAGAALLLGGIPCGVLGFVLGFVLAFPLSQA